MLRLINSLKGCYLKRPKNFFVKISWESNTVILYVGTIQLTFSPSSNEFTIPSDNIFAATDCGDKPSWTILKYFRYRCVLFTVTTGALPSPATFWSLLPLAANSGISADGAL